MEYRDLRKIRQGRRRRLLEQNAPCLLILSVYVLLLLSRLMDTEWVTPENQYLSVILMQIMIFLFPGLIFCKLQGSDFTSRLRLTGVRPSHVLLILSATLTLIAGSLLIGIQTGGMDTLARDFTLYDTFSSQNEGTVGNVLYLLLAYAALPALCEELVFRGMLCAALEERVGLLPTMLCSTLYFGMLHFQFRLLPMYLFAGFLLSLVLYATRSLPAAMAVHFLNNVFGLFGRPALSQFYLYTGSTQLFTFLLVCLMLVGGIFFCGEAGRCYRRYAEGGYPAPYRVDIPREDRTSVLVRTLFPPAGILCVVVYILASIF